MIVTFLVELNLDTLSDLLDVSEDITDDLSAKFDVKSVKPWARPTLTAEQPTTTNTQLQQNI